MTEWIKAWVQGYSYFGVMALMVIENVFPPIPSELIMPLAGFFTTNSDLSLIGVVLAGTLGSVIGALPLYYAGKRAGHARLRRWCERHGKWIGLAGRDLDKAKVWFERHGTKTVLLCRLVPGVRSLISIPAGVAEMPLGSFLVFTAIGSAVWAGALATAGRALGGNYETVERVIGPISMVVMGSIVLTIAIRAVRLTRQQRKQS